MSQIRCTIYTRKSSEEGLEQSFNSLDAQREACEAYIRSQRHEGWQAITAHYDDGGFSGGNMERPALKRLMADIEAGKVQTIVVYKVDRLTRSLADFAKIIEKFDAMQVSFVSVTQQFNTTTSMGRLTLNVLLSFAQFEREVTGERIRDKIAASKKKGMWMGGHVPLGYDLRDRRIYINPKEAKTVRAIFSHYIRLGCVMALKDYLDKNDIRSKPRTRQSGTKTSGTSFSRGALYRILRNHLYVGEVEHKGAVHSGQHEAIIDREQWNQVQKLLSENRQGDRLRPRATKASLFTGLLFDVAGNLFTPTHAIKAGRRYRYYTSQAVIRKAAKTDVPARIPAHDLEAAVTEQVVRFLLDRNELVATLADYDTRQLRDYTQVLARASAIATGWQSHTTTQQEGFLKGILDRMIIHPDHVEVLVSAKRLFEHLRGSGKHIQMPSQPATSPAQRAISLKCPFRHIAKGNALRLIVGDNQAAPEASRVAALKAIARARFWYDQLISGEAAGIRDLARIHGMTPRYVTRIFRLVSLSPATVDAILSERSRPDLTLDELCCQVQMDWTEQHKLSLGV